SLPPPTQGFAALAILAMLEGFDIAGLDDTDHVHLAVEATKLALEDRDRYLTDPTVVDVPGARCLDPDRLARPRAVISRPAAHTAAGRAAGARPCRGSRHDRHRHRRRGRQRGLGDPEPLS